MVMGCGYGYVEPMRVFVWMRKRGLLEYRLWLLNAEVVVNGGCVHA